MSCNTNCCNFGNTEAATTTVENITWAQITPLLMNADRVFFDKFKIDSKGIVTQDDKTWALTDIEWSFKPLAESKSTFTIKPIPAVSHEAAAQNDNSDVDTDASDSADSSNDTDVVEVFDFLSGVFKLYYDSKTETIFGEVETVEAGLAVIYRYKFHFYGKQKVSYSDLLAYRDTEAKPTSALNSKENIINRVIAL